MVLNAKILSITAGSILGIAFILFVVSNAVPSWGKLSEEGYETTIGLWKSCSSTPNLQDCVDIKCPQSETDTTGSCSKILAARAFLTLSCIMSVTSALCLFISAVITDKIRQIVLMIGRGVALACLIMGIIGVAIGINATTANGTGIKLGWGAASIIGVVAIIINLCGTIASILIK